MSDYHSKVDFRKSEYEIKDKFKTHNDKTFKNLSNDTHLNIIQETDVTDSYKLLTVVIGLKGSVYKYIWNSTE